MQKKTRRALIPPIVTALLLLAAGSLTSTAAQKRQTFSLPNSTLLFGTYEDIRIVTPQRELKLRPPVDQGYNGGYFAFPALSPRGDAVAWGVAVAWQKDRHRARFALAVYSLSRQQWNAFGDFDRIGTAAFSSDGSRIAVVADTNGKRQLLIFDRATERWTAAPYPTGGMSGQATMSWSPDDTHLVVQIERGGVPYSPQMSSADANRSAVVGVLDLASGNVKTLGEGYDPSWSPDGAWIAYVEPGGATCVLVHPDGSERRVVKRFRRLPFYFDAETSFVWGGPVWSPDSKQILFTASASEPYVDVMLLDLPSGRTTTQLKKALPIFGWATTGDTR